ncbi:MAG: PAS domain S-box protein [Acidobacteriaceae bacterium]
MIWSVDLNYRLVTFNDAVSAALLEMYAVPCRAGMRIDDLLPPELAGRMVSLYDRALTEGRFEVAQSMPDGRCLQLHFYPIVEDGLKTGVWAFCRDISAQRNAEDALRQSEERYRATFEQAPVGIVHTSLDGAILRCNPRFAEIIGYPLAEIPGMTVWQITLPEDVDESRRMLGHIAISAESASFEKRCLRKDGSILWCRLTSSLHRDASGAPAYSMAIVEDIGALKTAQEELQKAEEKYRDIFEDAPEGIFQTTKEGKALVLSPAGARMLGFASPQEAVDGTRTAGEAWMHPEDRAAYVALVEERGEVRDHPCLFRRKDGTPIWISLTARKVVAADGQTYHQGFMADITLRRQLTDALNVKVRELQLLSEMNAALVSAETEEGLLTRYCQIIVETGGYRMAWVGFGENSPDKRIVPAAHYGYEAGYLETVNLAWSETERGKTPAGRAIRTGEVQVAEDILADADMAFCHVEASKRGYRSTIALPFHHSDGNVACLIGYGEAPRSWPESERALLEEIATDLGFGITTLRTRIANRRFQEDLRASLEQTIQVIAETVDQRDPYTAGHERRVADLCTRIAGKLGLDEERTHGLNLAAHIHDLGKIGIPAELLSKPGRLTPIQFTLIQEHAQLGYEIVKNVSFPWPIAQMILQHHERLDGSGYPQGLKGDAILTESKILAVADVVEAMSSHRPYRAARGAEAALEEILAGSGTLYDAEAVDACVRVFREDGYEFPG